LSDKAVELLQPVLFMEGSTTEKLTMLEKLIGHLDIGAKGIAELRQLFDYLDIMSLSMPVELDLTLARGLNYYTGAIFEVKAAEVPMGSICGGGRYDNLTGVFGMPDMSGVGISFGADRIYDVMQSLELFPEKAMQSTQIIFLNFGEKEMTYCLPFLQKLREKGLSAEIFPDAAKIKKQLRYADQKQIPIVVMAGESEMIAGQFTIKQMQTGEQITVAAQSLIEKLAERLKA